MIEKVKTVYYCEHCKHKGMSKHFMSIHEKWCSHNPENSNKCSGCIHMKSEDVEIVYSSGDDYGEHIEIRKSTSYLCTLKNQIMHPLKAEKKKLPERYPKTFKDSILFPKECESSRHYVDNYLNQY